MRLLLDEMFPSLIAGELRARGHDVISVHESPGRGAPDEHVFDFARSERRAVVTENVRDYRPIAAALLVNGETYAALVLTTEKRWPRSNPGALIAALERLLESTSEQPLNTEIWLQIQDSMARGIDLAGRIAFHLRILLRFTGVMNRVQIDADEAALDAGHRTAAEERFKVATMVQ